jgi:RHS repeat-associated protein
VYQKFKRYVAAAALALLSLMPGLATATDETIHFHNDPSGTPMAVTDSNGNLIWKASYQPYGKELDQAAAGANNALWFHGKPYDPATGLSYFGARNYDPLTGRFTGIDPQGFGEGNIHSFNRYAYGNNNPYRYIDPDGRAAFHIHELNPFSFDAMTGGGGGGAAVVSTEIRAGGEIARAESRAVQPIVNEAKGLPDATLVCRGGACKAENFLNGSGVKQATNGTLSGVSTQSRTGASVSELAKPFKNNQVGVTTAGDIRAAGGRVTADGHVGNPNHATVDGLTPQQLERLFSPTIPNPVPPGLRGF